MKDVSVNVKILYDMVSKAHCNLLVSPIKTQYIYSSDDTVKYFLKVKERIMIYLD